MKALRRLTVRAALPPELEPLAHLVANLRKGHSVTLKTADKVRAYMAAHAAQSGGSHPLTSVALQGEVGVQASCGIYAQRPSVCREVLPSWEFGAPSAQCDKARAAHGLAPLTPQDWIDPSGAGVPPLPRSA